MIKSVKNLLIRRLLCRCQHRCCLLTCDLYLLAACHYFIVLLLCYDVANYLALDLSVVLMMVLSSIVDA
jgi:hypothetical protein